MQINSDPSFVLHYRKNTDDYRFTIRELVIQDMYRFNGKLSAYLKNKEGIIIDCGAHIGVFSKLCAEKINGTVHSFEPQPENFEYLRKNMTRTDGRQYDAVLLDKAVGLEDKKIKLYSGTGTGMFSCVSRNQKDHYIEVDCVDLREYISRFERVKLLKLDLEGYEAHIINNGAEKILSNVDMLVLEEHDCAINHELIKRCGFKLWFYPTIGLRSKILTNARFWKSRHFVYIKK
jgi:FkbM family methyltransferase